MALTDNDADAAFRFLAGAMRETDFEWVTTQVEEMLAIGKVQTRKLGAHERAESTSLFAFIDEQDRAPLTKARSAMFAVSEQFSPQERLTLLIDAIELAIPALTDVAAAAVANLQEIGIESFVQFAPEADITEAFSLSASAVAEHEAAALHLRDLLEELRREVKSGH